MVEFMKKIDLISSVILIISGITFFIPPYTVANNHPTMTSIVLGGYMIILALVIIKDSYD
jgi:hypothetical protein